MTHSFVLTYSYNLTTSALTLQFQFVHQPLVETLPEIIKSIVDNLRDNDADNSHDEMDNSHDEMDADNNDSEEDNLHDERSTTRSSYHQESGIQQLPHLSGFPRMIQLPPLQSIPPQFFPCNNRSN